MARRFEVGSGGRVRLVPGAVRCAGCGVPIVWRGTKKGKWQPVNVDGAPHFATCPVAAAFRPSARRPVGRLVEGLRPLAEAVQGRLL